MPKNAGGKTLKEWKAIVDFSTLSGHVPGKRVEVTIKASTLIGAVGRAAREARKLTFGKFNTCTVVVETVKGNDSVTVGSDDDSR